MRKPIVVVGSINFDLVATGDRVPLPGETLTGREFATFHGGKGANRRQSEKPNDRASSDSSVRSAR
jgi:hypothetical protein